MKDKITGKTVGKLQPGQSITDNQINGFRARCLPSGKVTFDIRYWDDLTGSQHQISLGMLGRITVEQARALAHKAAGEIGIKRAAKKIGEAVNDGARPGGSAVVNCHLNLKNIRRTVANWIENGRRPSTSEVTSLGTALRVLDDELTKLFANTFGEA
jgi:hypothetical protein